MRGCKQLQIETNEARNIFQAAQADYRHNGSIFCCDAPRVSRVKQILDTLPPEDRNLIILYSEVGSMVKTAAMMKVAKGTLRKNIDRIRNTIKAEL